MAAKTCSSRDHPWYPPASRAGNSKWAPRNVLRQLQRRLLRRLLRLKTLLRTGKINAALIKAAFFYLQSRGLSAGSRHLAYLHNHLTGLFQARPAQTRSVVQLCPAAEDIRVAPHV
jgi:hypothetical protein